METEVIPQRPWSIPVYTVWVVAAPDLMSMIGTPTLKSINCFSIVSFVKLFWGSLMITLPIGSGTAKHFEDSGSEIKLSLLTWG